MSDDKIDDKIHIVPRGPAHLGATCVSCDRCWTLDAHVSLRNVKSLTRHQCSATTEKQKAFPEVEPERTVTDPESLKQSIAKAKAERGLPSVNLGLGRR